MSQYYNFDLLNWGEIETMSNYEIQNVMKKYDFVIIESSIDIFFEERINIFNNIP